MCTQAKVKVKARTEARTSEKVSDLKVQAKVKEEVYQARNVDLENQSEQASTTATSTQGLSSGSRTTKAKEAKEHRSQ